MKVWEVNYEKLVYIGIWEQMNTSEYVRAENKKSAKEIAKKMLGIKDKDICFVREIETIN